MERMFEPSLCALRPCFAKTLREGKWRAEEGWRVATARPKPGGLVW
ncbi:MAG: hypothetical protein K2U26_08045 [Cyclobacteriaceae bacterium]|nr:hypothetical protein [Cyclobacteriaceae bacterium]